MVWDGMGWYGMVWDGMGLGGDDDDIYGFGDLRFYILIHDLHAHTYACPSCTSVL
jgi:hypothetical protein